MEINQKKFSNNIFFEFKDENLKYTLKEKGSRNTFSVDYGSIPLEFNELEERNEWFRNLGLIWILVGILQMSVVYFQSGNFRGSFWFGVGLICLVIYKVVRTNYTIYPTEKGNVCVIKDKQHDLIIEEIMKRKKAQLLDWYGDINFENDPENEVSKFKWLNSEEIISDNELKSIIEKIAKVHPQVSSDNSVNTNMVH